MFHFYFIMLFAIHMHIAYVTDSSSITHRVYVFGLLHKLHCNMFAMLLCDVTLVKHIIHLSTQHQHRKKKYTAIFEIYAWLSGRGRSTVGMQAGEHPT
jgi:hypothetical protein